MAKADQHERRRRALFNRQHDHESFAMVNPQRAMAKSPALRTSAELRAQRRERQLGRDITWQTEAYEMCGTNGVGEASFIMHLTANTVSLCELLPVERTEEGVIPTEDARALRVAEALLPPRGGLKEIKRRLALHASIAGEWYLIGTPGAEGIEQLGILWEALSVRELKIDTGKVSRTRDGSQRDEIPDDCYIARGWMADAEYSDRADCQMRRALSACREVAVHGQVIEATSLSRIAAGLLFVPEEMSFGGDETEEELTDEEAIDSLSDEIIRHLSGPIEDRSDPARFAPLLIRGPSELGEKIRVIDLSRDFDSTAVELRDKALVRLARQLDVPPEMMEGKSSLSGLGGGNVAESIDADFLAKHVKPLGEALADFLTVVYLRPMLEAFEDMAPDDASRFSYEFDMTPVAGEEDKEQSATRLHDRRLLSDEAMVATAGFEPGDMPSVEERRTRIIIELLATRSGISLAPALLPLVPGFEGVDLSGVQMTPAPPTPAPLGAGGIVDRLAVAADAALERAVERAAQRLINSAQSNPPLRDRLRAASKLDAFRVVEREELERLSLSGEVLFAGAWDSFAERSASWLRAWLEEEGGLSAVRASDAATLAVGELCEQLQIWALGNLHRGLPTLSNGLRIPTHIVSDAVRSAIPIAA